MPTFLAVYRGSTIRDAQLIGVSVDPGVIAETAKRMLTLGRPQATDPAVSEIETARRRALRIVVREAELAR